MKTWLCHVWGESFICPLKLYPDPCFIYLFNNQSVFIQISYETLVTRLTNLRVKDVSLDLDLDLGLHEYKINLFGEKKISLDLDSIDLDLDLDRVQCYFTDTTKIYSKAFENKCLKKTLKIQIQIQSRSISREMIAKIEEEFY